MKKRLSPAVLAWAVAILGFAVAFYERSHLAEIQLKEKTERFEALAERTVRQLSRRMQIYEYGLRGTRGAVLSAGSDGITREKFYVYSRSRELEREFPGARGFGFIRRVSPDAEDAFLHAARADNKPGFLIRQLTPHTNDRLVIQYIEPESSNLQAVGLDIASEPIRRQAAIEAMRSTKPTLTHPITLVQAKGKTQQGFLFLLPIYRPLAPIDTVEQRLAANVGFAYAPLLIDEVLADFDLVNDRYSLALFDERAPFGSLRFFASAGADEAVLEGLVTRRPLTLYGREWIVEIKARPGFIADLNHLDINRVAGELMVAFILLAVMVYLLMHNIQRRRQSAIDHAKLAAIVESSTDAIIGKDLNGVVTSWNRAAETIFGFSASEAIGKRLRDLVIPPELVGEESEILSCIARGIVVPHRTAVRQRKDGELIDVSITVSPIRDRDGRVIGASKTVRDVTDENRRERRFRLAVDAAGVGVWVWHLQTNQLSWDQRMFELYGAPASLLETGLYYDFWKTHVHPDDIGHAEEKLRQHLESEGIYDPIFRVVRDNGEIRWIQASATIEYDHRGNPLQMVGTNLDITEQTLANARILELNATLEMQVAQRTAQLQDAVDIAQRANEAKSEFLSNMSHEIRTPMNAVLGLAYLLQQQNLPSESRRMVEKIHGAGHALLGIINDILDFSKIEAKRMELESVPFRLSDVLDNLASIMASAVGDKPVETIITPPPAGADHLKGDALRLGQVLINLVSNAIKFTAQGEVVLNITRVDTAACDEVRLRFSVRDTGIGIPEDKLATIFQAFSQADASTTRSYGGTGLGLTISARLVELMGGTLTVVSHPGQGSEFSFAINLGLSDPRSLAVPQMAHQRILIADDQSSARAALADTVTSLGWHAETVASGEEAVRRATANGIQSFDILLLDWRMPQLDGLNAARQIRAAATDGLTPIIIMVTAFDREHLQTQIGSEFVDLVLTKPVTSSCLYNAVQLVKQRRGELAIPLLAPAERQQLAGVRVLVVDDSEINREVACRILAGEGATVDLAEDGSVALEVLTDRPDDFDVVLMDMQMPVMDGYAATRQLRATPGIRHLPVIALTAGAFATQRQQAIESGVNAFVAKPFEIDQLIAAILALTGSALSASAPGEPPAPALSATTETEAAMSPASVVINVERALLIWKDDATYAQFLRKFAESHWHAVHLMREHDQPTAARIAHKLRGAAAQLGLEQLSSFAGLVERRLNEGGGASDLFAELDTAMQNALAAINRIAPEDMADKVDRSLTLENPITLAPDIRRLLQALDTDDIGAVEPIVEGLTGRLPDAHLSPLRAAVANYDFRAAEVFVNSVANTLNIDVGR